MDDHHHQQQQQQESQKGSSSSSRKEEETNTLQQWASFNAKGWDAYCRRQHNSSNDPDVWVLGDVPETTCTMIPCIVSTDDTRNNSNSLKPPQKNSTEEAGLASFVHQHANANLFQPQKKQQQPSSPVACPATKDDSANNNNDEDVPDSANANTTATTTTITYTATIEIGSIVSVLLGKAEHQATILQIQSAAAAAAVKNTGGESKDNSHTTATTTATITPPVLTLLDEEEGIIQCEKPQQLQLLVQWLGFGRRQTDWIDCHDTKVRLESGTHHNHTRRRRRRYTRNDAPTSTSSSRRRCRALPDTKHNDSINHKRARTCLATPQQQQQRSRSVPETSTTTTGLKSLSLSNSSLPGTTWFGVHEIRHQSDTTATAATTTRATGYYCGKLLTIMEEPQQVNDCSTATKTILLEGEFVTYHYNSPKEEQEDEITGASEFFVFQPDKNKLTRIECTNDGDLQVSVGHGGGGGGGGGGVQNSDSNADEYYHATGNDDDENKQAIARIRRECLWERLHLTAKQAELEHAKECRRTQQPLKLKDLRPKQHVQLSLPGIAKREAIVSAKPAVVVGKKSVVVKVRYINDYCQVCDESVDLSMLSWLA